MRKRGIQIIDPQSALPSPKLETKCLGQFRFDRKCKCKFRRPKTYSTVSSVEMERERERERKDLPLKRKGTTRCARAAKDGHEN